MRLLIGPDKQLQKLCWIKTNLGRISKTTVQELEKLENKKSYNSINSRVAYTIWASLQTKQMIAQLLEAQMNVATTFLDNQNKGRS